MHRRIYTQPILINGVKFYPKSIMLQAEEAELEVYKTENLSFSSIKVECILGVFTSEDITISEIKNNYLDLYNIYAKNIMIDNDSKLSLPHVILTVKNKQLISIEDVTRT